MCCCILVYVPRLQTPRPRTPATNGRILGGQDKISPFAPSTNNKKSRGASPRKSHTKHCNTCLNTQKHKTQNTSLIHRASLPPQLLHVPLQRLLPPQASGQRLMPRNACPKRGPPPTATTRAAHQQQGFKKHPPRQIHSTCTAPPQEKTQIGPVACFSPAAWAASPDMLRRAEATAAAAGRLTAVLTSAETCHIENRVPNIGKGVSARVKTWHARRRCTTRGCGWQEGEEVFLD